eukprot:TRINITY_DN5497_c0_g1_i1.p1 TRINITY_DN5497_c0_g1~~TRINITY_DN5497_c0_g1_i1.p1  ORF type:complete len:581 (-),score=185.26 TRINITY_DN5497_c0_g1_i1:103-1845(-)
MIKSLFKFNVYRSAPLRATTLCTRRNFSTPPELTKFTSKFQSLLDGPTPSDALKEALTFKTKHPHLSLPREVTSNITDLIHSNWANLREFEHALDPKPGTNFSLEKVLFGKEKGDFHQSLLESLRKKKGITEDLIDESKSNGFSLPPSAYLEVLGGYVSQRDFHKVKSFLVKMQEHKVSQLSKVLETLLPLHNTPDFSNLPALILAHLESGELDPSPSLLHELFSLFSKPKDNPNLPRLTKFLQSYTPKTAPTTSLTLDNINQFLSHVVQDKSDLTHKINKINTIQKMAHEHNLSFNYHSFSTIFSVFLNHIPLNSKELRALLGFAVDVTVEGVVPDEKMFVSLLRIGIQSEELEGFLKFYAEQLKRHNLWRHVERIVMAVLGMIPPKEEHLMNGILMAAARYNVKSAVEKILSDFKTQEVKKYITSLQYLAEFFYMDKQYDQLEAIRNNEIFQKDNLPPKIHNLYMCSLVHLGKENQAFKLYFDNKGTFPITAETYQLLLETAAKQFPHFFDGVFNDVVSSPLINNRLLDLAHKHYQERKNVARIEEVLQKRIAIAMEFVRKNDVNKPHEGHPVVIETG